MTTFLGRSQTLESQMGFTTLFPTNRKGTRRGDPPFQRKSTKKPPITNWKRARQPMPAVFVMNPDDWLPGRGESGFVRPAARKLEPMPRRVQIIQDDANSSERRKLNLLFKPTPDILNAIKRLIEFGGVGNALGLRAILALLDELPPAHERRPFENDEIHLIFERIGRELEDDRALPQATPLELNSLRSAFGVSARDIMERKSEIGDGPPRPKSSSFTPFTPSAQRRMRRRIGELGGEPRTSAFQSFTSMFSPEDFGTPSSFRSPAAQIAPESMAARRAADRLERRDQSKTKLERETGVSMEDLSPASRSSLTGTPEESDVKSLEPPSAFETMPPSDFARLLTSAAREDLVDQVDSPGLVHRDVTTRIAFERMQKVVNMNGGSVLTASYFNGEKFGVGTPAQKRASEAFNQYLQTITNVTPQTDAGEHIRNTFGGWVTDEKLYNRIINRGYRLLIPTRVLQAIEVRGAEAAAAESFEVERLRFQPTELEEAEEAERERRARIRIEPALDEPPPSDPDIEEEEEEVDEREARLRRRKDRRERK